MKTLHDIRQPIPQEYLDAASILQAMYNRDYPPYARMWFFIDIDPDHITYGGPVLRYWCDRWTEDPDDGRPNRYWKGDKKNWSTEEIRWLKRYIREYPEAGEIPDLTPYFVEAP